MADFKFLRQKPPDLARYLPAFLYGSEEFAKIQAALEAMHKEQWLDQIEAGKQGFVNYATWGLTEWEHFLGLTTDETLSYKVRRSAILAKLNGSATVTVEFMERVVNSFTTDKTSNVVENYPDYSVYIYLPSGGVLSFEEMDRAIRTFMPAHLGWKYLYNTKTDANLYLAGVLRPNKGNTEIGKLTKDTKTYASFWQVSTAVFEVDSDDEVRPTEYGLAANPVWDATDTYIRPSAAAPVGSTDGIFEIDSAGNIVIKE